MWYWLTEDYWRLIAMMHHMSNKTSQRKPMVSSAPVKHHESHRRVMRSVNRNR